MRLAGNSHSSVQAFAIDRDGIDFWGMQYHPEFSPSYVERYFRRSGWVAPDVADDLEAARLSTTMWEQATPRRMIELAKWLARL